jgi:hypothetical protein
VRLFLTVPALLPKAVEITRARGDDAFWAPWGDVTQRVTFGVWTLEIYPLRTVTGERQMMAYWPAHQLLYTSDLFTISQGFVFLPQQVGEAVEAVGREHLAVTTAFGMHYDALPWTKVVESSAPPLRAAASDK